VQRTEIFVETKDHPPNNVPPLCGGNVVGYFFLQIFRRVAAQNQQFEITSISDFLKLTNWQSVAIQLLIKLDIDF